MLPPRRLMHGVHFRSGLLRGIGLAAIPVFTLTAAEHYSLILPPGDHQPVGTSSAVLAGTTVARTSEAAGAYSNPATIATLGGETLSGSANALGLATTSADISGADATLFGGLTLQGYAGYTTRWPPFTEKKIADGPVFALLWCTPMSWEARTDLSQSYGDLPRGGGSTQVTESSRAVVAALAWTLTPQWRVGGSLQFTYDYASFTQEWWAQRADGAEETSSTLDSWTWSVRASAGVCWEPTPGTVAGLSLTSAAAPFWRSGMHSYHHSTTDTASGDLSVTAGDTDEPRVDFRHPWQLSVGAGTTIGAWQFDAAVQWVIANGTYDTVRALAVQTTTISGGNTTVTNGTLPAVSTSYRNVVNARVGASYELTDIGRLQFGGFTDRTWVESSDVYDAIDLYGITGGITLVWPRVELTFGVQYEFSGSAPVQVFDPRTGQTTSGEARLGILSGLVGGLHRF